MLKEDIINEFLKVGCKIVNDDPEYIVLDGKHKFREVFITLGRDDDPNHDCGMTIFGNGIIEFYKDGDDDAMILNNVLFRDIANIKYIYIENTG